MNKKLLTIFLSLLLISACGMEDVVVNRIDAGKLISTKEVATSFNDSRRTKIVTTKGIFYVNALVSSFINVDVWINEYDSGRKYMCISGVSTCKYLIGS